MTVCSFDGKGGVPLAFGTPAMIRKYFLDHPATVGESYGEHFGVATGVGVKMILGGIAALIHGLIPRYFETTGSRTILELHSQIMASRTAKRDADSIEWKI
jgi:Family of unknown function (DUF6356)